MRSHKSCSLCGCYMACCALCMDDDGTEIVFSVCPGIVGWQLNGNLGEVVGKWESLPLSNYNESMDYTAQP